MYLYLLVCVYNLHTTEASSGIWHPILCSRQLFVDQIPVLDHSYSLLAQLNKDSTGCPCGTSDFTPPMRTLTPPYHFGIVAAPVAGGATTTDSQSQSQSQILYRGAFPAARNAPFLNRLGIKTLVCLRKKPWTDEDPVTGWARRKGIDVQWIKAERMGEETLGMERDEVNDVLKVSDLRLSSLLSGRLVSEIKAAGL